MSRRDTTKRDKLRAEEMEVDKQLRDAGIDMTDISLEEKKAILLSLEESCKSAKEEESQRQQLQEILSEALDKSFTQKSTAKDSKTAECTNEERNIELAVSTVGPDAEHCSSGSTTPDLVPMISESPRKAEASHSQSNIPSSGNSVTHDQSPRHSEDMFLFSQSSTKLGVDENVIKDCIETIRVSESEDDDHDMSCSPSIRNKSPRKEGVSDITSSVEKNSGGFLKSKVSSRTPLRRYQSADVVSTPNSKTQDNENEEARSSSQPFSLTKLCQVDADSLISPVIGRRGMLTSNEKKPLIPKKQIESIQDAEISNSLSVECLRTISPDLISDDDSNGIGIHSSSGSQSQSVLKESSKAQSSLESGLLNGNVRRNKEVLKRKSDALDSGAREKRECQEPLTSTTDKIMRKSQRDSKKFSFQSLDISDSDEDPTIQNKKAGKKNCNVFFTLENDISLKKRLGISEDPEKAFFKNDNESVSSGYERILNFINKSLINLEKYQSSLSCRMPWPLPIGIDKRVKDSLDRTRAPSKRQVEINHTAVDIEPSRMVTRNAEQKTWEMSEQVAYLSEESLPDITLTKGDWIDARKKTTSKRRGVQLGLSRKHAKITSNEEVEDRVKGTVGSMNVINESDSEDFDLQTSSVTRLPPFTKYGKLSTPVKDSDVDSSKMSSLSRIDEDRTNFELGDILADSQQCESSNGRGNANLSPVKARYVETGIASSLEYDSQPSTSGVNLPRKRPRKTFSLQKDEEPKENSEDSITLVDKSDISHNVESSLTLIKSNPQQQGLTEGNSCSSPTRESEHSSVRRKEPLVVVKSSSGELKGMSIPKQNSEEPTTSRSISSTGRRRGTTVPLKPPPLRLKNKRGRDRGKVAASEERENDDGEAQLPSTSEQPHQAQPGGSNIRGTDTKVEEAIECPLCMKSFPISVIEAHASTCGEVVAEIPTQQPAVNSSKGKRRLNQKDEDVTEITDTSDEEVNVPRNISRTNRRERTPPNHERCMHCKGVYKAGDSYLLHVRDCLTGIQASPSTSTNSRTPSKGEQGPTSNHLRVSRISSVFERLEELEEQTVIPTSPVRNYIPVSQQLDSLIDYRNQFHGKASTKVGGTRATGKRTAKRGKKRKRAPAKRHSKKTKLK